jgi:hypothetical protein
MPDRRTVAGAAVAILAIAGVSLLFIGSYAGALHEPTPHDVPVAVVAQVPAPVAARIDASRAFRVERVASAAAAARAIDRREVYGALVSGRRGLELVVAPAAGPAAAVALRAGVAAPLRRAGTAVRERVVHPLPAADARGLVGFYTAIGWVVAGYLGATLLSIVFGARPGRRRLMWRVVALAALGLLTGVCGAALANAIGDMRAPVVLLGLTGALTILAVGAATVAMQALIGVLGTGIAILVFVVLGNPASGGPFPIELLPEPWRAVGPLVPNGATTTLIRDIAYFPDAPLAGPLAVLIAWLAVALVTGLLVSSRRGGLTRDEAAASLAAAAAP